MIASFQSLLMVYRSFSSILIPGTITLPDGIIVILSSSLDGADRNRTSSLGFSSLNFAAQDDPTLKMKFSGRIKSAPEVSHFLGLSLLMSDGSGRFGSGGIGGDRGFHR